MRRSEDSSGSNGAGARPWASAPVPSWASSHTIPGWLALREGTRPLVFVAPHGGRRVGAIRRGANVNDLETAEIAWTLAERLDAHAIVNHALDRNEIDLNRITHLTARAPEVLALLTSAIDAASRRGQVPLVLFVHGWNMVVPCCDVGIGLRRRAGLLTGRFPTLARSRFDSTISAIESELQSRGVSSAIGRRYTASGRDNAAQLFSGRHLEHENDLVASLSTRSLDGRVDAAQLELGIPLRWPGPLRTAFEGGLVAALSRDEAPLLPSVETKETSSRRDGWDLDARAGDEPAAPLEAAYAFQAVLDADSGLATFCGVESTGPRSMAARFSLVFTDGSMMLLVGEGEWSGERGQYHLEGFDWHATDEGRRIEVRLRAPMIRYPTHDAYLDLEQGLAGSRLVDASVHLVAEALSPEHARLRGRVETLGRTWDIDTVAFLERAGRRSSSTESRVRVLSARDDGAVVIARSGSGDDATLLVDDEAGALGAIRAVESGAALRDAEILARVPVWRPAGQGVVVRWQFGIVRCSYRDGSAAGLGLFDRTDVFGLPDAPAKGATDTEDSDA